MGADSSPTCPLFPLFLPQAPSIALPSSCSSVGASLPLCCHEFPMSLFVSFYLLSVSDSAVLCSSSPSPLSLRPCHHLTFCLFTFSRSLNMLSFSWSPSKRLAYASDLICFSVSFCPYSQKPFNSRTSGWSGFSENRAWDSHPTFVYVCAHAESRWLRTFPAQRSSW